MADYNAMLAAAVAGGDSEGGPAVIGGKADTSGEAKTGLVTQSGLWSGSRQSTSS